MWSMSQYRFRSRLGIRHKSEKTIKIGLCLNTASAVDLEFKDKDGNDKTVYGLSQYRFRSRLGIHT